MSYLFVPDCRSNGLGGLRAVRYPNNDTNIARPTYKIKGHAGDRYICMRFVVHDPTLMTIVTLCNICRRHKTTVGKFVILDTVKCVLELLVKIFPVFYTRLSVLNPIIKRRGGTSY